MAGFNVELLGPGTTVGDDAHAYIQNYYAQKNALTDLLMNEHILELTYQGKDGERKSVENLLASRLQALEHCMKNEIDNMRGIRVYQSTLNILRNLPVGESIALLRTEAERYLETSRSQDVANTQELHEFKIFIDEIRNAIVAVGSKLRHTNDLLSSASDSLGADQLASAIWAVLRVMVAAFGLLHHDRTVEAWRKAAAKLLRLSDYKLKDMLDQFHEPARYRVVRGTLQAYHDGLATVQEGLLQLNSVMFGSSTKRGTGLPLQRLWDSVLERLGLLANFDPGYQLTEEEVNAVMAFWFETTQALDKVTDAYASNHGAVFNEVTRPDDHENPDKETTLESQPNNLGTADDAWGDQDSSDIGIDTDQSDTDTDDLSQVSADAPTPSTNPDDLQQLILTPTEDGAEVIEVPEDLTTQTAHEASSMDQLNDEPVNAAELSERLSQPNRAMRDSTQRLLNDCMTIREKFGEVLKLPNLDLLMVDKNIWTQPAHSSNAQASNGAGDTIGGKLRLKDVVEGCWQEYVDLEDDCRAFMNDLKLYADSQITDLPAVLAPDPNRALPITAYIAECMRRIKDLEETSAAIAKQHKKIYERWEKCLLSLHEQLKKEEARIKKASKGLKDGNFDLKIWLSAIASLTTFGFTWYFWAHLGLTVGPALTAVVAGGLAVYSVVTWNRKAILKQIAKDRAMVTHIKDILTPMCGLEQSLKDLKDMYHNLYNNGLADVKYHMDTKEMIVLRARLPKISETWRTMHKLCVAYIKITSETLNLNPAPDHDTT